MLGKLGYQQVRESSSHIRLTGKFHNNLEHHINIPKYNPIKIGTLNSIISDLADHLKIEKKKLVEKLFDQSIFCPQKLLRLSSKNYKLKTRDQQLFW